MDLMVRRLGQMEQTFWYSSTGKRYEKTYTLTLNNQTLAGAMSSAGVMKNLEHLIIDGKASSTLQNGVPNPNWSYYFPKLKSLKLKPTTTGNAEGQAGGWFKLGHYAFAGIPASLTYMELGGLQNESLYFYNGGYFRNDFSYRVGNTNGLTLIVYRDVYDAKGGFINGSVDPNTTIIQYHYQTGALLTAS